MIRLVEIELFSFCNRKCKWCPNSYIDRYSQIKYLDCLDNLIQQLKNMNYSNYISFSRYNEPMAQIDYFKSCLKQIRSALPKCVLVSNTNGDYLTEENLNGLEIDELSIMDYDNKGLEYCINKLTSNNCIIDNIQDYFIYAHYENIKILYYVDWQKHSMITDRGGNLTQYKNAVRAFPCNEPQYFIGINYDGTVSPCCNIRNDSNDKQKSFILGDLHSQSLSSILESPNRKEIITKCGNADFSNDSPCYCCLNNGGRYTRENGGIVYG